MARPRKKTDMEKDKPSKIVQLRLPNLLPPSPGCIRSRSPENNLAIEMMRDPTDPNFDVVRENNQSSAVWAQLNTPLDPADPLQLGRQSAEAWKLNRSVQKMGKVDATWRAVQKSVVALSEEDRKKWEAFRKQTVIEHVAEQRAFQTDESGSLTALYPWSTPAVICQEIIEDHSAGWRFPGGNIGDAGQAGGHEERANVIKIFHMRSMGSKRDLLDGGHAYAGLYPPVSTMVEQVGGEGFLVLGTQRFAIGGHSQYKYVKAKDVEWDKVMQNGSLGNLIIMENDEEEE